MKLKKTFVTHTVGGQKVLVSADSSFNGMVRCNGTGGEIIELLKEETTAQRIVDAMLERYEASREVIEEDVNSVIEQLRSIGAIEE